MSLTFSLSTVKCPLYQVQRLDYWDIHKVVDTFRSQVDAITYADMLARDTGELHWVVELEA